jgi:hypothetical protein
MEPPPPQTQAFSLYLSRPRNFEREREPRLPPPQTQASFFCTSLGRGIERDRERR